MYFTAYQIGRSIGNLSNVHPFHGITFLACKKAKVPVGREIVFPLDTETDHFLREHHQIDPGSNWFFQPFKSSDTKKKWVRPDYAAKGLQAINTQTFRAAFLHKSNSRIWGWAHDYVETLAEKLLSRKKIPAFDLAVWLFRDFNWPSLSSHEEVIEHFVREFSINQEEKDALFDLRLPRGTDWAQVLQDSKPAWRDLRPLIPAAPDARPDQGGTLVYMETKGLGPAQVFVFDPAPRLSLITGDNGLGKSFLLEVAWWCLTGVWAGHPSYPASSHRNSKAEITFAIEGESSQAQRRTIVFDWKTQSWPPTKNRPTIPGLTVYARVDGSFAVWDPSRPYLFSTDPNRVNKTTFSNTEVWDALPVGLKD
jgi:hypothetical protein